ncbi:conserved hypothetical protein [Crenothrix polyspora]|uniref:Pvc16 N-terminal domain-containing protein n=1 Tax=Crenothrix polyspora TaxID=360316 RepID=A0A1R4H1W0_9GAMM|nr:DUF4255 domain-containing protein [Crenothrix polyspora]SJM90040.1 conserved hypothetical protein [Crenothrix polyspora]
MSNALAIAGVTAVIRDLLDNGLIDHQMSDALGRGVIVSVTAPDTIELTGANAVPRLNLFLHQVTPNAAWRNVGFPSHDGRGNRTSNPPLALDLHYLLTAYGTEDLQAEVLLGYAMQLLHETPVLARDAIRRALNPTPVNGNILPSVYQALRAVDLAEQVEQIKITPTSLNTEEMSRFWSALQAHYRPTVVYQVSVVLIESSRPARSPLPVLSRGTVDPVTNRESGVDVQPSLIPAVPMIESIELPGNQVVAQLDKTIIVKGHHLGGTGRTVVLTNDRFKVNQEIPVITADTNAQVDFKLPNSPTVFPVGVYLLAVKMTLPKETAPRTTNQLPLVIAPEITTPLPTSLARKANGSVTINLDCRPEVRMEQRVSLLLGNQEINATVFATPSTAKLIFEIAKAIADPIVGMPQLVRLRVDGIESPIIDRSGTPDKPPTFFDHRITIT